MLFVLFAAHEASADTWTTPGRETVESSNGQWRLVVIPKLPDNGPRAELYRRSPPGTWALVQRWTLVNEVCPVSALVANDGTVVTFDNWASMGYGDDVVVIYRPDGTLVRQLGLNDLLEQEDIQQLRRSVSSIWWSGEHRIDEQQRRLVLQIAAQRTEEVPLSLETGEVLVPKRRMFPPLPRPRVTWTGETIPSCEGAHALTAGELVERATLAPVPDYPTVARKARIAGTVLVDITISETGEVEKAVVVKPLPFGIDQAAHDAVGKWRFEPVERDGTRVRACGRVRMSFELAVPDG